MSNSVNKKEYQHFVPEAKIDESFPGAYKFNLISSLDELREVLSIDFHYMSFDTETSSLNPEEGFIVGYSFCFDGVSTYYVPVKHITWGLGKEATDLVYNKMVTCKKVFMYNARFDMRYMEYAGYDMSLVDYYDVQIAVAMSDTNWKKTSLKWAERHFLGWTPDSFSETLGENANFYYTEPEQVSFYAGTDALGTFKLAQKTLPYFQEGGLSAKIENNVLYPLMKMEDMALLIDIKWLQQCLEQTSQKLADLERRIFDTVGYTFEINSNKQKAEALQTLGITTGKMTKTGNMAVSAKAFEALVDRYEKAGEAAPQIVRDLEDYSKTVKLQGSYIEALLNAANRSGGKLRFSYKVAMVPTGRLACGKDGKNTYFAPINLQSIPKPHPKMWYYRKAVPESNPEHTVLGWEFSLTPFGLGSEERWCEGKDPNLNVRNAFVPEKGQLWVSVDYCIDPESLVEYVDGTKHKLSELDGTEALIKTPYGFKRAHSFRYTGKKKVCKLKLIDGREVRCSEDHQFKVRTDDGKVMWKPLKDISLSDYILIDEKED